MTNACFGVFEPGLICEQDPPTIVHLHIHLPTTVCLVNTYFLNVFSLFPAVHVSWHSLRGKLNLYNKRYTKILKI